MDLQHRIGLIVQGNMQCNSNEQHQVIRQTQTMNLEFRFSHFPFVRGFIIEVVSLTPYLSTDDDYHLYLLTPLPSPVKNDSRYHM